MEKMKELWMNKIVWINPDCVGTVTAKQFAQIVDICEMGFTFKCVGFNTVDYMGRPIQSQISEIGSMYFVSASKPFLFKEATAEEMKNIVF